MSDVLEELVTKFTYDVDDAGLRKYLRGQEKINRNTKTMIGLNTLLGRTMKRIFFGAGAIFGVKSLIDTYRNFDLVQRSLNALSGSAEEGAKHFEFLKKAALSTATDFNQVAKAYRGYYYAAKTAGLTNEELQHSFLGVMVGARVLGSGKVSVGGAMLALEQMLNKTTVQAEEMNRQLGNAISGAREMSAEAMGMSVSEFTEKMQKKLISSAEFVKKFGDYMYQQFIKKLPEALKSLDAGIVNMQNAWLIFQYEIMKGGLGEELTKLTGQIMKLLLSPEAKSFAQAIGSALNMVGKALSFIVKHFKAILFFWGVSSIIQGIVSLSALRWKILDIATTIDSSLFPATSKIVYSLRDMLFYGKGLTPVLQSVGKAALMVGKNFLWVTLIAIGLYHIYLLLEDIYTYFVNPEWDSFTKQLVSNHKELKYVVDDMRKTYEEMKPIIEEIKGILQQVGIESLKLIKDLLPYIIKAFKVGIIYLLIWLHMWEKILSVVMKVAGWVAKIFNKRINPPQGNENWGTPTYLPNTTLEPYKGNWWDKTKSFFAPKIPQFSDRYYGGMDLTKTETTTKTVTNHIQVNAQNKSDAEILALLEKAIGGEIDTVNDLLNPTQKYMKG